MPYSFSTYNNVLQEALKKCLLPPSSQRVFNSNISLSIAGSFSDDVYLEFHRDKFSFSWQRITLPKKENRMALNQLSEQKEE